MRIIRYPSHYLDLGNVPGARRWAAASLVDSVGTGLMAPITVLYFTRYLHLSTASVSTGLAIAGIVALCLTPLAGAATDRFGAKRSLIGYWALAAVAYATYAAVQRWDGFVVVTTMALASGYATKSVKQCFLAELAEGQQRIRLLAVQRSIRNVGFGVGGLLATVALALGGRAFLAALLVDAASYLLAIVVIATIPLARRHADAANAAMSLRGYRAVAADRRYLVLAALDFLVSFQATALVVALPLWVVEHTSAPGALVGVLFTINTVLVVVLQVRVTRGIQTVADTPRLHSRGAGLFVLAAVAYLAAQQPGPYIASMWLVAAVLLHTATELYASTAEWTLAVELADPQQRGKYAAVFWSGNSLQQAIGPAMATGLLAISASALWPTLAALVGLGSLASALIVRSRVAKPQLNRLEPELRRQTQRRPGARVRERGGW